MTWQFNQYMPYGSSANLMATTRHSRKSNGAADIEEEEEEENKPQPLFPLTAEEGNGDKSLMIFGWDNPIRIASAAS